MAIIEISIGKSKYKIECPEEEKSKLLHLAKKLDGRIKKLLPGLINVDEKTLLVISALMAEDDLESAIAGNPIGATENFQNEAEASKINEDDMYIAISENIENVAEYIEKLAKKIDNY